MRGLHFFILIIITERRIFIAKTFLTYEQQLQFLETQKNLIISDHTYAEKILEELSYYSLVSGYKSPFKHISSNKYLPGVTFEELVAFYYFDEELRTLFLKYLLHVERHIKSMFSYFFCQKYGENQAAYLNIQNYNYNKKTQFQIHRLIQTLHKSIALPSQYRYINHYSAAYHNVPLWVTSNVLTFGQISKMYQYATTDIRSQISKTFNGISEKQLHQFITIAARCRNVCAHGERLYSFQINESIPDTLLHQKLQIKKKKNNYIYGKKDLFAVVITLKYLISHEDFKNLKANLSKLINNVLSQCPHLTKNKLLSEMGFPENWESISRYRKI